MVANISNADILKIAHPILLILSSLRFNHCVLQHIKTLCTFKTYWLYFFVNLLNYNGITRLCINTSIDTIMELLLQIWKY